jgi:hypothetical protein
VFKVFQVTAVSISLLLAGCASQQQEGAESAGLETKSLETKSLEIKNLEIKTLESHPLEAESYSGASPEPAKAGSESMVSGGLAHDEAVVIDASGNAPLPFNAVTPQWTESYLEDTDSALLGGAENDHVNSYYYFGLHGQRTLIGLERVKGSNFQQYFSLLIFDHQTLLGYYENIPNLPFVVTDSGQLTFPRGYELDDVILIQQARFPPLCLAEYPCVEWVSVADTKSIDTKSIDTKASPKVDASPSATVEEKTQVE